MDKRAMIREFVKETNKQLKRAKSPGRIDVGADIAAVQLGRLPTGILGVDIMSNGGLARGWASQFWGPFSTAKTATALVTAARTQRDNGSVYFAAIEPFSKSFARKLDCKIPYNDAELDAMRSLGKKEAKEADRLEEEQETWAPWTLGQHLHGDGILEMVYKAVKKNIYDLVIIDSLGAIKKYDDIEEKSLEDDSYGGEGKLFARFCGKLYSALNTHYDPKTNLPTLEDDFVLNGTTVICINQARDKIGGFIPHGASKQKPVGGEALKHLWGTSLEFSPGPRHSEKKGDKKQYYAQTIQAWCDKSKVGPPFREAEWKLYFENHGDFKAGQIDTAMELTVWAPHYGLVERKGAWYIVEGERYNGGEALYEGLRQDQALQDHLYQQVLEAATRD